MAMRNKYTKRSRISEAKIREVVRYVAADLTALQAAALSGLNRNTVNRLYRGVRDRMRLACEAQRRLFGVVEVDESFFGARRVKGRRGARRLRQDRRLRHLRAAGPRLYRDRPGLLEAHAPGYYPRPGGPAHRHQLRWLAWLPRHGRSRLWPLPRRSCPGRVHQGHRPYQRHRGLLGPGQSPADQIQGPAETQPSTSISRRPNGDTTIATPTSTNACYSTYARTRSARHDPKCIRLLDILL